MLSVSQLPLGAWELTSSTMLLWLAAALVPWLVHRLLQRPQRTTDWAAVELLLTALQRRSQQINFQQWLLLLLRMAAIALVAIALAGPMYRPIASGTASADRQHVVLVLDRSFSMTVDNGRRNRFQRAQEAAREILASSDAGDVFSLIAWDRTAESLLGKPTFDANLLESALEGLEPSHSPADLSAAVEAVAGAIDRCVELFPEIDQHLIVFCSDRTQATWTSDSKTQERLESLSQRANMRLISLEDTQQDNVAIVEMRVDPRLVLQEKPTEIISLVRSYGKASHQGLPIDLVVDGRRVARELVDITAGQIVEVRFPHAFVESGTRAVEVTLSATDDALPLDNRRHLVVDVRPRLRVACVAGYPGATDEIVRALVPHSDTQRASSIVPKVVPQSGLNELSLSHYDVVMLCSVRQVTRRESQQILRYLKEGGSLVVLLGNSVLGPEFASLLPMEVAAEQMTGDFRFDPLDYRHPIVLPFQGRHSAGLLGTTINRYVQLRPHDSGQPLDKVLAFDTGDLALAVQRVGQGRVAMLALPATLRFSSTADKPWSSFPASPSFLPIVRELLVFLVGDQWTERHNLLVGDAVAVSSNEFPSDGYLHLVSPSGTTTTIFPSSEDSRTAIFEQAGIYFRAGDLQVGQQDQAFLAVNLDPHESDLSVVAGKLLPSGQSAVQQVDAQRSNLRWGGTALAGTLLFLALSTLLMESTLAWWLGRSWG